MCFGRIGKTFIVLSNSYVKSENWAELAEPIRWTSLLNWRGGLLFDYSGVDDCASAGESLEVHVFGGDFDKHERAVGVEAFVGDGRFI